MMGPRRAHTQSCKGMSAKMCCTLCSGQLCREQRCAAPPLRPRHRTLRCLDLADGSEVAQLALDSLRHDADVNAKLRFDAAQERGAVLGLAKDLQEGAAQMDGVSGRRQACWVEAGGGADAAPASRHRSSNCSHDWSRFSIRKGGAEVRWWGAEGLC